MKNQSFYENTLIKKLSKKKLWTFSDKDKRPIDVFSYLTMQRLSGVREPSISGSNGATMDLPTLRSHFNNLPNYAYYLNQNYDDIICLDIEKTCPKHIKEEFLKLPFIYGEYSMSGKGVHLFFKTPKKFYENEEYKFIKVLKENNGYYEILLNHWVTFTKNTILPKENPEGDIETLFDSLIKDWTYKKKRKIEIEEVDLQNIPNISEILRSIHTSNKYTKTLKDFNFDHSTYEYGMCGFLYNKIKVILSVYDYDYSDDEIATIIYTIAKEELEYRDKHEEFRENLPWLLYLAKNIVSKDLNRQGDN